MKSTGDFLQKYSFIRIIDPFKEMPSPMLSSMNKLRLNLILCLLLSWWIWKVKSKLSKTDLKLDFIFFFLVIYGLVVILCFIIGNPYPPDLQRLVPGRENCKDD